MYSENLIRETQKEMEDIEKRKQIDYINNIAYAKKLLMQKTGKTEEELTEAEIKKIRKDEFDDLNKPSTIKLHQRQQEMEEMKLKPVQEMLLKKLI